MKPRTPLVLTFLLLFSAIAFAQKDPRGDAKKHYAEGKRLYEAGQYEQAIAEFKAADELAPSGVNDFNIALAYEELGKEAEAIRYYDSYLDRMPNADNKAEVEKTIDRLKQQLAAEEASDRADEEEGGGTGSGTGTGTGEGTGTGTGTGPAASTGDPELDRVAAIDVGSVRDQRSNAMPASTGGGGGGAAAAGGAGAGAPVVPPTEQPKKKSKPIYKQWWFWVVAGVSAYVLISILASDSSSNQALELPNTPEPPTPGPGFTFHF